jgi:hypothetical protein
MNPIRPAIFASLLCLLLAACIPMTQEYVPVPPFELTATALPSETPLALPTAVPLFPTITVPALTAAPSLTPILPSATPTATALPTPSGFTAIFVQSKFDGTVFLLVGGADDKRKWYGAGASIAELTNYLNAGSGFDFYGRGKSLITSGAQLSQSPTCVGTLKTASEISIEGRIGVKQHWPVTYRSAQVLPSDTAAYVDVVKQWLISQGLTAPEVKIQQVLRVDLEGDGPTEVLISAARFKEPTGHLSELGDYSVVLVRKVVGNNTVTIPLVSEVYLNAFAETTFPKTYGIFDVADLNGDKVSEIIVDMAYWEGLGAMVYNINGDKAAQVLKANCP